MTLSPKQIALLNVIRKQLGWDEDVYRAVLAKIAKVASATEMDQTGLGAVLAFAEHVGFAPMKVDGPNYGHRPGFASPAQITLIRTLWIELHHCKVLDEEALNGWLLKYWKVSSLRFLKADQAPRMISALKSWKSRAA